MKAKRRRGKSSDQANTERAYQALLKAMKDNPDIEPTMWAGACWTALINGYLNSGVPLDEFLEDFEGAKAHYAKLWANQP